MKPDVPFLPDQAIDARAAKLVASHFEKHPSRNRLPVPVDEILEFDLGLALSFDDLRSRLAVNDVLGATWVDSREVFVDQSLDPDVHPEKLGRYRFTLAHEVGHWQLHRECASADRSAPSILCRSSQAHNRTERQADLFAAALLMPAGWVREYWKSKFGNYEAVYDPRQQEDSFLVDLNKVITIDEDLASVFGVSIQAMRIRLEQLGLLLIRDRVA